MKDYLISNKRRSFLYLNSTQINVIFNHKQSQLEIKNKIYVSKKLELFKLHNNKS